MMEIICGGIHTDERGTISFVNDFDMANIRRFYSIDIPDTTIIRAWQGHKLETKCFYVQKGSFLVCAIKIDNWENPSAQLRVEKTILHHTESKVLIIPGGYVNGFKALKPNSSLIVFSDFTIEESKNDDYRFKSDFWKM